MRHRVAFWLAVTAGLAASRLPFLDAGYGLDPDAWRMAEAAGRIAAEGRYFAGHPPGAPVQEITSVLLVGFGPVGLNGATALLSVVAALALARVVWLATGVRGAARDGLAAAAALGFGCAPLVYVNSTVALDYVWAIAFVALALQAACAGRPLAAGLWLGVAAGCRITSLLALLPVALCTAPRLGLRERLRGPWLRLVSASASSAPGRSPARTCWSRAGSSRSSG